MERVSLVRLRRCLHRRERLRVDACMNPGTDAIPALFDDPGDSRQAPCWRPSSTSYVLNSGRPHINRTRSPTIAKLPNPQVLLLSVAERADSRLPDQSLLTTSATWTPTAQHVVSRRLPCRTAVSGPLCPSPHCQSLCTLPYV